MRSSYAAECDGVLTVGNQFVEISVDLSAKANMQRLVNKITGKTISFDCANNACARVACDGFSSHIPLWQFHPGTGNCVSPEDDFGYQQGFHKPDADTSGWTPVSSLNEFPIAIVGYSTIEYPGYGWYVSSIELPENDTRLPLELRLGGCDNQDWLDYRVYLNGELIGSASPSGYSHTAPVFIINPDEPGYKAINFGGVNTISVQARGLDRRFPGMHRSDAERYSIGSFLSEQTVSFGPFSRDISDFRVLGCNISTHEDFTEAVIDMQNDRESIAMRTSYRVNNHEPVITKQIVVQNIGDKSLTLLELDLQSMQTDSDIRGFGQGFPCFIDDEVFVGIQHPSGAVQIFGNEIKLTTFPGRILMPGDSYESKSAVFGAGKQNCAGSAFTEYLESHSYRKPELLRMSHCYGIHDIAGIDEPTDLTEEMLLSNLDDIARIKEQGMSFDYYFIDAGWSNPHGDLRDFDPRFFPDGPDRIFGRVRELDMKLGLWTAPSAGPMAFHPGVTSPELCNCGTLPSPDPMSHRGTLCIAAEPWRSMYRDALIYHIRNNGVSGFKLDGNTIQCSNPDHGHLLGKYSVEAVMDAAIEILEDVRRECPDVFIMYYWNIRSPWWLLWGNTIYERGVLMEGSTTSDHPAPHIRQSVNISFDQATHHAWDLVPIRSGDSLGVWISKWRWANYVGREQWRDAWLMDIARGSMMCQIWGDLSMFSDEDIDFLCSVDAWVGSKADLLRCPKRIIGSPWKLEPYGYAYEESERGLAFVFNPTFDICEAEFDLCKHHLKYGLQPFELKIVETGIGGVREYIPDQGDSLRFSECIEVPLEAREISCRQLNWDCEADAHFLRRAINGRASYADVKEKFTAKDAEYADQRDTLVQHKTYMADLAIPELSSDAKLELICQASRDGVFWHHRALYDIIIPCVAIDGSRIDLKSTPHRWHEEAGGWSWICFEAPISGKDSGKNLIIQLDSYLPQDVELTISARICLPK